MRIIQDQTPQEIIQLMQEIKVDPYGIKIMSPKARGYLVKIDSVSNVAANILKQEMLSLGGDVALSRDALTGKSKKTGCLIMGTQAQINRLNEKLKQQPLGLNKLGSDLIAALNNYQKDKFILNLGRYKLNLSRRVQIMGIVNLTPDSFSGDGLWQKQTNIFDYVQQLVRDGADIIDIGGESTRPGSRPVTLKEELTRTIPLIKKIAKKIKIPLSIDTYKPEVARQALDNGACTVNDITGLRNPQMMKVVAKYQAGVVIMHMQGNPRNMQSRPRYDSLIDEIIEYLNSAIKRGISAGISRQKMIIDPGIGFGKTLEHNLQILKRLSEFKVLGQPIMVGVSRKSFIGQILGVTADKRIYGTLASCVLAAKSGARILRVHDVKAVKQALLVSEKIIQ